MIFRLVATGFGGYWIWSGIQLARMPGCSTVGIGGSGRVISFSCHDPDALFAPSQSLVMSQGMAVALQITVGLALIALAWGGLVRNMVRYRRAVEVVRAHSATLSRATGKDPRTIEAEIVQNGLTPGEWALANGLDPLTFQPTTFDET